MENGTRMPSQMGKQKHWVFRLFEHASCRAGSSENQEVDGLAVLLVDLHRAPLAVFWRRTKRQTLL